MVSVIPLSNKSHFHSNLLKFNDCEILMDCGMDLSNPQEFQNNYYFDTPNFGLINPSSIDAVLITNHENIAALPYLTALNGFRADIYCTEPTLEFGRLLMLDTVNSVKETVKTVFQPNIIKTYEKKISQTTLPITYKNIYDKAAILACLKRVKYAQYNEQIKLFNEISFKAVSSGYTIGSCSWVIETLFDKIVYLGKTSIPPILCLPVDLEMLKNATAVIIGFEILSELEISCENSIQKLTQSIADIINNNGNVILPLSPMGLTFNIISSISQRFDNGNLSNRKIYFISPVAKMCLDFANIYSEWLGAELRSKVAMAQTPFNYNYLTETKRLICAKHPSEIEIESNSVIICSHASMKLGSFKHYFNHFKNNPKTYLMITNESNQQVLQTFDSSSIQILKNLTISSLTSNSLLKIIQDIKPKYLISPETDWGREQLSSDIKIQSLYSPQTIFIDFFDKCEKIHLSEDLCSSINLMNQKKSFCGQLSTNNDISIVNPISKGFIKNYDTDIKDNFDYNELNKILKATGINANVTKNGEYQFLIKIGNQMLSVLQRCENKLMIKMNHNIEDVHKEAIIQSIYKCLN